MWKGWKAYAKDIWNYIDLSNLLVLLNLSARWMHNYSTTVIPFKPEKRFDYYSSLSSKANFLKVQKDGQTKALAMFVPRCR